MSITNHPTAEGVTTAEALRRIADWLDGRPDVQPYFATVEINPKYDTTREEMERFAEILGPDTTERTTGATVTLERKFGGGARVVATAWLDCLAPQPPQPQYEPILKPTDSLEAATGEGSKESL